MESGLAVRCFPISFFLLSVTRATPRSLFVRARSCQSNAVIFPHFMGSWKFGGHGDVMQFYTMIKPHDESSHVNLKCTQPLRDERKHPDRIFRSMTTATKMNTSRPKTASFQNSMAISYCTAVGLL